MNSKEAAEQMFIKHFTVAAIKEGETEESSLKMYNESKERDPEVLNVYLNCMTEYRSIGEREAREQVINELVGWMEMQQLQHSHKSHVFSTLSYCIHKAKSLFNQQGEETKLNP